MEASSMPRNGQYEKEMRLKKAMLWQTVAEECTDACTSSFASTCGDSKRASNLLSLAPHRASSRSSATSVSTGQCSSRTGMRSSSLCSCETSESSMQSSRTSSIARSATRANRTKDAPSLSSSDSAPASPRFTMSVWGAGQDDDDDDDDDDGDRVLEVEKIEAHTKQSPITEREYFFFPSSDSRPRSRLSDLDDDIFGTNIGRYAGALNDEPADPFADAAEARGDRLTMPTPPASTQKARQRPGGHRKLPPVSLEVAEAALKAVADDLTPSAHSGDLADSAAANASAAAPAAPPAPPTAPPAAPGAASSAAPALAALA
mmetsp:Transcript_2047/g.5120  ORF Transcript_2047/g.5120 Transcript_2047/m.5120 type:complete len:318 (+) Transcript_2047:55-1008(+)